jgi:phosphohistidine phosphatase
MSRQLLIMRHAKSDWSSDLLSDFERPLNQRGRAAAPKMGRWLRTQGLTPDYVVSSPAKRARQTVLRVCRELEYAETAIHWEESIYEAAVPALCRVLADCPAAAQRVLLIGHNPGLENLAIYLAEQQTPVFEEGKHLPTAALVQLAMPADWKSLIPGCGRFISLTRPRSLAD